MVDADPGAKPFVPFGKGSKAQRRREHGTLDHMVLPGEPPQIKVTVNGRRSGNAADLKKSIWNSEVVAQAAVRSAPGRDRAEAGFIEALDWNATRKRQNAINSLQAAA